MEDKEKKVEKTESPDSAPEKKKKPSGCLIFLIILALLVGGAVAGWKYLTAPDSQDTTLLIDSGKVQVNGSGAKNKQVLQNGDVVKTESGAQATIAFSEGPELRLDENSEVKINSKDDNISVFQNFGRTWSRVVSLLGVPISYEVETSNVVASVRGTAFLTDTTTEETNLDVDDGTVDANGTSINAGSGATTRRGQRPVRRAVRRDVFESDWVNRNRDLDRKLLERVQKRRSSIRQVFQGFGAVSPGDIAKLRGLAQRAQSGQFNNISEAQAERLSNLNYQSPADIATALSIIDPENFSDTAHWTQVLKTIFPLIQRFGVERVFSEQ